MKSLQVIVLLSAAAAVSLSAQQIRNDRDGRRFSPQPSQLDLVAARTSVIEEIVAEWAAVARDLGVTDGWDTELREALARLNGDRLLLARAAKTCVELNAVISGVAPATLARLKAAAPSIDAVPTAGSPPPNVLGSASSDLVFFPLTPCRIVDTRNVGGTFSNTEDRSFRDDLADFSSQGGNPAGCGLSDPDEPAAIAVNLTITSATGYGFLRAYPVGAPLPATRWRTVRFSPSDRTWAMTLESGSMDPGRLTSLSTSWVTSGRRLQRRYRR